jgi:hypothetical protein
MEKLNLAIYYLLPLVELSKSSFGDNRGVIDENSNFINCYLSTENFIVVKVKDIKKVPQATMESAYYLSDIDNLIIFRVTGSYVSDIMKFRDGKYSQFSQVAKDRISIFTGLPDDHLLIRVLTKDPLLKLALEEQLDAKIPEEAELKGLPDPANFINITDHVS